MKILRYKEFDEKLDIKPVNLNNVNLYRYFPKTKDELKSIIADRIEKEGPECDLNDIDVSKVTEMTWLFYYYPNFNGDISKWDVSNVTTMHHMFDGTNFNGDISGWDVSNVTDMCGMFDRAAKFNCDISGWNVSNVRNISYMFYCARAFNRDLSGWDISSVRHRENLEKAFAESGMGYNTDKWPKPA